MKQYIDLLKRIAEEEKPVRFSSEKLINLFESAGIEHFLTDFDETELDPILGELEVLERNGVYDPRSLHYLFYEALIEYIDGIEAFSVLWIFKTAYNVSRNAYSSKDPRLMMNEYRSWTHGSEDVVMAITLFLLKLRKGKPDTAHTLPRFIKRLENEYDKPQSFYRAIIRKLIEMAEEQQAISPPAVKTSATAEPIVADAERAKGAIQQVLDDARWHRQGGFTKSYWYAIYRVYELKFQPKISYSAFAELMQSWGLTQTDISENIKHAAGKNTLSCPLVRWNDLLAQKGTTTAEKKQIQVAQHLLELLK